MFQTPRERLCSARLVSENDELHCPGETALSDIQGDIPAKPAGALPANGSIAFSPGPRAQAARTEARTDW